MKNLFVLMLICGTSFAAQAGNMKFTCKNADATLIITRDQLVFLREDESKQYDLLLLDNSDPNIFPNSGESLVFSQAGKNVGQLEVRSLSGRQTVKADDGEPCRGGRTPGYLTESYQVSAELSLFNQKSLVQLSCVESSYWHGTCRN